MWKHRTIGLILAATLASGCATGGTMGGGNGATGAAQGEPELSQASQRKFADALRAWQDGLALNVVDWDALAKKFQAVVDADDRHAEAHHNLGVIAEQRGLPDEAATHYRKALSVKPGLRQAHENLGLLLEGAGDLAGAEEQYKSILLHWPTDAGARARLASLHLDGGDRERALELAREALLREPKNLKAHEVVARVHLERGQLAVAHLVASRAVGFDDKHPGANHLLGMVLEKRGERPAAIAHYRKAVEASPGFLPSRVRLGELALESRDWSTAAEQYEVILRHRPDDGDALLDRAIALRGLGQVDEAFAAYEKAQALAPDDPRPQYGLAVILHRHRDDPEAALVHYRRFLSGSVTNLPTSHPVFMDMRECEQLVQFKLEERALAERAAREAELEAAAASGGVGEKDDELLPTVSEGADTVPTQQTRERDPDEPADDF